MLEPSVVVSRAAWPRRVAAGALLLAVAGAAALGLGVLGAPSRPEPSAEGGRARAALTGEGGAPAAPRGAGGASGTTAASGESAPKSAATDATEALARSGSRAGLVEGASALAWEAVAEGTGVGPGTGAADPAPAVGSGSEARPGGGAGATSLSPARASSTGSLRAPLRA